MAYNPFTGLDKDPTINDFDNMFGIKPSKMSKNFRNSMIIYPEELEANVLTNDYGAEIENADLKRLNVNFITSPQRLQKEIQYQKADEQTAGDYWAHAGGRALSIGTKMLKGASAMPGLHTIAEAAFGNSENPLFDNFLTRLWKEADDALREGPFKIHKGRDYETGDWIDKLSTPEFWSSDAADGAAFFISAYLGGKGMSALTKSPRIVGSIGTKLSKAQKLMSRGKGFAAAANEAGLSGWTRGMAWMNNALSKASKAVPVLPKNMTQLGINTYNTIGEASSEALELKYEMKDKVAFKNYGKAYDDLATDQKREIEEDIAPLVAGAFRTHAAGLMFSNLIETKALHGRAGIAGDDMFRAIKSGKMKSPGVKGYLKNIGANIITENWEERMQTNINRHANYVNEYENNKFTNILDFTAQSALSAFNNITEDEDQSAGFLGSLLGAIGGTVGAVGEQAEYRDALKEYNDRKLINGQNKEKWLQAYRENRGSLHRHRKEGKKDIVELDEEKIKNITTSRIQDLSEATSTSALQFGGTENQADALRADMLGRLTLRYLGDDYYDNEQEAIETLKSDLEANANDLIEGKRENLSEDNKKEAAAQLERNKALVDQYANIWNSIEKSRKKKFALEGVSEENSVDAKVIAFAKAVKAHSQSEYLNGLGIETDTDSLSKLHEEQGSVEKHIQGTANELLNYRKQSEENIYNEAYEDIKLEKDTKAKLEEIASLLAKMDETKDIVKNQAEKEKLVEALEKQQEDLSKEKDEKKKKALQKDINTTKENISKLDSKTKEANKKAMSNEKFKRRVAAYNLIQQELNAMYGEQSNPFLTDEKDFKLSKQNYAVRKWAEVAQGLNTHNTLSQEVEKIYTGESDLETLQYKLDSIKAVFKDSRKHLERAVEDDWIRKVNNSIALEDLVEHQAEILEEGTDSDIETYGRLQEMINTGDMRGITRPLRGLLHKARKEKYETKEKDIPLWKKKIGLWKAIEVGEQAIKDPDIYKSEDPNLSANIHRINEEVEESKGRISPAQHKVRVVREILDSDISVEHKNPIIEGLAGFNEYVEDSEGTALDAIRSKDRELWKDIDNNLATKDMGDFSKYKDNSFIKHAQYEELKKDLNAIIQSMKNNEDYDDILEVQQFMDKLEDIMIGYEERFNDLDLKKISDRFPEWTKATTKSELSGIKKELKVQQEKALQNVMKNALKGINKTYKQLASQVSILENFDSLNNILGNKLAKEWKAFKDSKEIDFNTQKEAEHTLRKVMYKTADYMLNIDIDTLRKLLNENSKLNTESQVLFKKILESHTDYRGKENKINGKIAAVPFIDMQKNAFTLRQFILFNSEMFDLDSQEWVNKNNPVNTFLENMSIGEFLGNLREYKENKNATPGNIVFNPKYNMEESEMLDVLEQFAEQALLGESIQLAREAYYSELNMPILIDKLTAMSDEIVPTLEQELPLLKAAIAITQSDKGLAYIDSRQRNWADKMIESNKKDNTEVTKANLDVAKKILDTDSKQTIAASSVLLEGHAGTGKTQVFANKLLEILKDQKLTKQVKGLKKDTENIQKTKDRKSKTKKGVAELFDSNPELANQVYEALGFNDPEITPQQKQQALEIYSQYLDIIFPNSQIKDIVYHGSTSKIEKFEIRKEPLIHFGTKNAALQRDSTLHYVILNIENIVPIKDGMWFLGTDEGGLLKELLDRGILSLNEVQNINTAKSDAISNSFSDHFGKAKEEGEIAGALKLQEILKNKNIGLKYTNVSEDKGSTSYAVPKPEQIHILGSKKDIEGFREFVKENNTYKQLETTQAEIDSVLQEFADNLTKRFKVPSKLISKEEAKSMLNINENEITYTDEDGNICAKMGGRSSKFTKGSQWEVIKEFKGASHERGGIDINISDSKINMTSNDGKFEAKYGVVISKNLLK